MFLTVAGRQNFRQTGGKFTKFDQMTRRLEREALNAYDDLLNDADTPSPVSDLVKTFCSHSHPSLMGLIEGLDVDAESDELSHGLMETYFGVDGEAALAEGDGDPERTVRSLLSRLRLRRKYKQPEQRGSNRLNVQDMDEEVSFGLGFPVARPGLADYYSFLLLSAVHHIFDVLSDLFEAGLDAETRREGKMWHADSLELISKWSEVTVAND